MNNDNEQNSFSKELSVVTDRFLPDNFLIQGMESLLQMKDNVIELDNALLELAKSSSFSAAELKHATEEAFRLGEAAGKTGTEVLSSITSVIQSGYGMKDALTLTEEALKMNNLSPGMNSTEEALGRLQNMMDGFGENANFAAGINDALALAEADVGIAMGSMGSDVAIQSADIALMNNDLTNIPFVIALARHTKLVMYQNIGIAFSVSLVMMVLAAVGIIPALAGAFLHNIGAFIILINSSRILRRREKGEI